ncbi:MAG TPA: D-aminoacyl-tRNA deacylase [Bacteroidales bacterium]|nr:D-tyrosyl-tRNA(Tyr) deacylase [Bacteroidales bacterium]HNZ42312.1 D-aminoacyl-tRNA deacylase [Bacteroidales bacterium]HOH83872.1 D-aminoacyl-tRNA deacylase [Bacteroidales bacterium]HPB24849.1 D-aminoacyl-tRNA deacylase [Bacteroidales bacterium]HPI29480.1 D-aminoacyl-tRNA deacylase [Bacteroidales bacterium]
MRVVVQRVNEASVLINNTQRKSIGKGLLVLLGIEDSDWDEDIEWLCGKVARLRIFNDNQGVMNLSVTDISGEVMVISQFTLHASTKKGNRPSYIRAAKPETAIPLYEKFIRQMETEINKSITSGEFGAYMQVELENDGPVTIIIDSKDKE